MAGVERPGGDAASPGDGRHRLRVMLGPAGLLPLALLVGLAVTQGFDVAAFGVLAPEIRHAFGLGNTGIDTVTALTAAVPVMCSIFLGYFGDKGNRLHLTVAGAALWGVAAIFTGLAPVLAVLVVARLFGGVGLLATQTIYPSLLSDFYPPEGLAQIFTVYLIAATGLGLMASPLAGWLGSSVGWRPTFVVLAVPTFVCAAAVARFLKEPARRAVRAVETETDGGGAAGAAAAPAVPAMPGLPGAEHFDGTIREGFHAVRGIRTLRRTWFAAFLFGAGTIPLATLVSNFFHDVYHVGATERGDIAAFLGVFGLCGIVLGGAVARHLIARDRLELFPIFSGVAVIEFGVFILVMAHLHSLDGSIGAACVLALGAVGYLPAYVTFVALIAPPRLRSQAYAWSLFFYALGAICLSGVIGAVADAHGQRAAMSLLALLVVIGGLIGLTAARLVKGDLARLSEAGAGGVSGQAGKAGEAELGHRNLITYSRVLTQWSARGGLAEQDGVLAYAGGSWLPVGCNGAFRTSDAVPPSTVLGVADAFFSGRKRGYSVKVRDSGQDEDLRQACEAEGLVNLGESAPEMICRQPLAVTDLPAGVQLRQVDDSAGVADFTAVNAEAYATYGMPADVLVDMFDRPEAVLADPDAAIVVAYRDETPMATALVYLSDGIACLQWVGTRPEARGSRLGEAVTVWTTNEAFSRGAAACTLQASSMGEPLYRRLGYETLYRYFEYVRWQVP